MSLSAYPNWKNAVLKKSVKIATLNKRIDSEVMRVKADLLFANGLYAFEKGVKATKSLEKRVFSEAYKYFLDSLHICYHRARYRRD